MLKSLLILAPSLALASLDADWKRQDDDSEAAVFRRRAMQQSKFEKETTS